ncbi:MAG TPA: histidinol dehydrogenase [Firmicutes bacterium]|nr:histidinol dehydrogenase [Bacillota bacterium]
MPFAIYSFEEYKNEHAHSPFADYRQELRDVREIIEKVRKQGDEALFEYTRRLDRVDLEALAVNEEEYAEALQEVDPDVMAALRQAGENIERFHHRQVREDWWNTGEGWLVGQRIVPLQSAGIYIPGGTAAYPSSVLMTVIPAKVAGVKNVFICTPPREDGSVAPLVLAAARDTGVTAVYKIGGAQAVAALAYGTETIPAVDKIVGPGNIYVTLAKKEVFGRVGIDMLAGPSEIVIVADENANPDYVAADLLSQAEHDPLSRSVLITGSDRLAGAVMEEVKRQIADLPRREIAASSLDRQGAVIRVNNMEQAWDVVNYLAPEHLELLIPEAWRYLDKIYNAGAIFLGPYSPEPLGDYWAGSSHVLPTGAAARYTSALGVPDFLKQIHVLCYNEKALIKAAPQVAALARTEGLEAHARAVLIRRRDYDETAKN